MEQRDYQDKTILIDNITNRVMFNFKDTATNDLSWSDNILEVTSNHKDITVCCSGGLDSDVITVPKSGTYIYEFSTQDGGATIIISDITPLPAIYRSVTLSTGSGGDHVGMMAYDADYIYTCLADYDGTTAIWKRVASGTTW